MWKVSFSEYPAESPAATYNITIFMTYDDVVNRLEAEFFDKALVARCDVTVPGGELSRASTLFFCALQDLSVWWAAPELVRPRLVFRGEALEAAGDGILEPCRGPFHAPEVLTWAEAHQDHGRGTQVWGRLFTPDEAREAGRRSMASELQGRLQTNSRRRTSKTEWGGDR